MEVPEKVKKIIFLRSSLEVNEYIKNKRNISPSGDKELCIAMTPLAHSRLKENGIETQNTLRYFSNRSHMELLKKSETLITWLRKNSDFVDLGIGIRESFKDAFIIYVRCALHYCLWTIEVVLNAVDRHKPEILAASFSGKKAVSSLYIEPEEKYLGQIVRSIAQSRNLKIQDTSITKTGNYGLFLSRIKNYALYLLKAIFRYGKFQVWKTSILAKNMFTAGRPVLFATARNMKKVVSEFCNKTIKNPHYFLNSFAVPFFDISNFVIKIFWRRYSSEIIEQKMRFKNLEKAIKNETELFSQRGVSFAGTLSQKIKDNLASYMLGQMLWMIELDRAFDILKPSALVSTGDRLDDILLAEWCRHRDIPDILISHGSHVRPKNEYEYIEWGEHGKAFLRAPFSSLALQSPLAEGYIDAFNCMAKTVKTGPLAWGAPLDMEKSRILFEKMFDEEYGCRKVKVVLHAGTPKSSTDLRFYVYETADEYVQAIRELANAIQKIPDTVLIVRFRPQPEIGISDIQRLVPFSKKVILSVNDSFRDVLGMSDLFVSFSSTTIEEALQNKIPVLLYGSEGRYQHVPAFEINPTSPIRKSAVYHVKEEATLKYAIKSILDLGINGNKDELFEPYIYAERDRISLGSLLKEG